MRQIMDCPPGSHGVTVTTIVDRLARQQLNVSRNTVRNWLDEDIERGVAERVTIGFYRLRQAR